jgi:predicted DNA-binding transcriptional regulator AlpA
MRKSKLSRPYPPDFVSAETLAYRLDCSVRSIQDYVKSGHIPKPVIIGNLVRWHWYDIVAQICAQNDAGAGLDIGEEDECATAIKKAKKIREKASGRAA